MVISAEAKRAAKARTMKVARRLNIFELRVTEDYEVRVGGRSRKSDGEGRISRELMRRVLAGRPGS